jgi:Co/Zn/Cd efflux system component
MSQSRSSDRHHADPHHDHGAHAHGHTHGVLDPGLVTTARGIWAVKWSFVGLFVTAVLQLGIVAVSGSVALLADTIHNFADAATAIPLWIAFACARLRPSRRFPYGYGRVEDLAGVTIVLVILASAVVAGYQAVMRLLQPEPVGYVWAVAGAAILGFLGNEAVAVFRIGWAARSAARRSWPTATMPGRTGSRVSQSWAGRRGCGPATRSLILS